MRWIRTPERRGAGCADFDGWPAFLALSPSPSCVRTQPIARVLKSRDSVGSSPYAAWFSVGMAVLSVSAEMLLHHLTFGTASGMRVSFLAPHQMAQREDGCFG
jgi:hypothetical protein